MSASPPPLLAVGRVARAHGVRGRVLVAPFNPQSEGLERASALWLSPKGRPGAPLRYEVVRAERANLGYLVALRGVDDRDAADALRGLEVQVDRGELPLLEEGEVWAVDLIGCVAVDGEGRERGRVAGLEEAGPNELLVLAQATGAQVLLPLALVREVDPEAKRILIDVPEGLFEAQSGTPPGRGTAEGA